MPTLRHALTGAVYDVDGDGLVVVEDGTRRGRFRADGTHVDGDRFDVDPHLCLWLAGPQLVSKRRMGRAAS